MNYRHSFHAGNFADVVKHIVLVFCLEHLLKKPTPFRVIDTHAGRGMYLLGKGDAERTGEWREGIGKIAGPDAMPLPREVSELLQTYFEVVGVNGDGGLETYPGSPAIISRMLRPTDRLVANELHPEDAKSLARHFKGDKAVKVMDMDGWTAVKALLPPPERRGLVLVDPPFEEPGELIRLTTALQEGLDRFKTGTFLLWYPIKDTKPVQRFHKGITEVASAHGLESVLAVELLLRAPRHPGLLNGSGLIVANPPFDLTRKLAKILPPLAAIFAQGPGASGQCAQLLSPSHT